MELRVDDPTIEIKRVGRPEILVPSQGKTEGSFFLVLDDSKLQGVQTDLAVSVYRGEERIDEVTVSFMGPMNFQ